MFKITSATTLNILGCTIGGAGGKANSYSQTPSASNQNAIFCATNGTLNIGPNGETASYIYSNGYRVAYASGATTVVNVDSYIDDVQTASI